MSGNTLLVSPRRRSISSLLTFPPGWRGSESLELAGGGVGWSPFYGEPVVVVDGFLSGGEFTWRV